MVKVKISATVVNPDTEEEFNGWVNPDFSRYVLYGVGTEPVSKEFDTLAEAEEWVEGFMGETEGGNLHYDGRTRTLYAADEDFNMESGERWLYAAHIEEL